VTERVKNGLHTSLAVSMIVIIPAVFMGYMWVGNALMDSGHTVLGLLFIASPFPIFGFIMGVSR
jgi:hypothetical protein